MANVVPRGVKVIRHDRDGSKTKGKLVLVKKGYNVYKLNDYVIILKDGTDDKPMSVIIVDKKIYKKPIDIRKYKDVDEGMLEDLASKAGPVNKAKIAKIIDNIEGEKKDSLETILDLANLHYVRDKQDKKRKVGTSKWMKFVSEVASYPENKELTRAQVMKKASALYKK